jgi:hypothetical protein
MSVVTLLVVTTARELALRRDRLHAVTSGSFGRIFEAAINAGSAFATGALFRSRRSRTTPSQGCRIRFLR